LLIELPSGAKKGILFVVIVTTATSATTRVKSIWRNTERFALGCLVPLFTTYKTSVHFFYSIN
jgi:hypothetical protein